MGDDKNNFPYLFSPSEPLFIDDAISKISIPEEPLKEDDTFIEEDSDLLSHSQMSWKDGFLTYEVLPAELTFETDIPEVIFFFK